MKINTSASGKVFLSGEYMALEGGRALILSTPQEAKVTIGKNSEQNNIFTSSMSQYGFPFVLDRKLNITWLDKDPKDLGKILRYAIKKFGRNFNGKTIHIDTDEFFHNDKKIGIGSSAAVSVSLSKALNKLFKLKLDTKNLIDYSKEIHDKSQNSTGSGFDIIAAYEEGAVNCILLEEGEYTYDQIMLPDDLLITGVINEVSSKTSDMITNYQKAKYDHPDFFVSHMNVMKKKLEDFNKSLMLRNSDQMLFHLESYSNLMIEMDNHFRLGIYNNQHLEILKLTHSQKILYKPSGAGAGDLGILVTNDSIKLNEFCQRLNSLGIKTFKIFSNN